MKTKLITAARLLLGAIFLIFGLNGFFQFLPMPPLTPEAGNFIGAMVQTGYFMTLVKIVEIVTGIMLLTNKFVPLSLTILAPVTLNIFLFHLFLDTAGMPMATIVFFLNLYLGHNYRDSFKGVLSSSASPSA